MSAVSIIGMKIAGYSSTSFLSTLLGPAPGFGIEIDSTPPATMQFDRSPRIEFAAMAMVCRPEEQKRLTVTPDVEIGRPASSAAWRPTLPAPWAQLPR